VIKMNRLAFMSVNRMRAGYTSLKANLIWFNILSTAECECDVLQTEEHIFWDCKRGEDQRGQWWTLCLRTAKKNTLNSVIKARGKKILQGVSYFMNKIRKFILQKKEKEINLQNINPSRTEFYLNNI
jgi:hypothetical protein